MNLAHFTSLFIKGTLDRYLPVLSDAHGAARGVTITNFNGIMCIYSAVIVRDFDGTEGPELALCPVVVKCGLLGWIEDDGFKIKRDQGNDSARRDAAGYSSITTINDTIITIRLSK